MSRNQPIPVVIPVYKNAHLWDRPQAIQWARLNRRRRAGKRTHIRQTVRYAVVHQVYASPLSRRKNNGSGGAGATTVGDSPGRSS